MDDVKWNDLNKTKLYALLPLRTLTVRCIIFPMSLIKTQIQSRNVLINVKPTITSRIRDIFKHEGVTGFYKGFRVSLLCLMVGPVYSATLETTRQYMDNITYHYIPIFSSFVGGFMAQSITQICITPIDIISQKKMVDPCTNEWQIIQNIVKEDGFRGFFRGLSLSICTHAPTAAIVWGSNNYLTNKCYHSFIQNNDSISLFSQYLMYFNCAGISGSIASFITMPMDTIRARKQVLGNINTKSTDIFNKIYYNEGVSGLWRGVSARMGNNFIAASCFLTSYQFVKNMSKNNNK